MARPVKSYQGNIIGKSYERLTILELMPKNKHRKVIAICKCGKTKEYFLDNIIRGITKSCRCLFMEVSTLIKTKHGLANHPLYNVWSSMISRCNDKNHNDYGGRGVLVCDEWKNDFIAFYKWAINNGWEKGLQLDKDKKSPTGIGKIYSPEFCSFMSRRKNLWYKRDSLILEYNNEKKSLAEWCDILGLNWHLCKSRIKDCGWTVKNAFETPKIKIKQIEYKGQSKTISEWAIILNTTYQILNSRLNKGWGIKKAFETN